MDKGKVVLIVGLVLGFLSLAASDDPEVGPGLCGWSCCFLLVGSIMMNSARQRATYVAMPMMQQHAVPVAPQMMMQQPAHQTSPVVSVPVSQMGAVPLVSSSPLHQSVASSVHIPVVHGDQSAHSQQPVSDPHDETPADYLSVERREELYEAHLVSALVDGAISEKEDRHLTEMRRKYGISDEQNDAMVRRLGHDPSTLEILKKALAIEQSGRYADAAAVYEAAGQHERANMLRMKSKAMDSNKSNVVQQTTYNIHDSAVTGGIGFSPGDEDP